MEDVGPSDLPQPGVSHGHIEPVVSARVRLRGEAGLTSGTGGGPDTGQGDTDHHQAQEHCEDLKDTELSGGVFESETREAKQDNILFFQLMY